MANDLVLLGQVMCGLVIPAGSGYPVSWMVSRNPFMEPRFRQSLPEWRSGCVIMKS